MCNLYSSITTNQAAIINLFRVVNRYVGNLAPMPGVFRRSMTTLAFATASRETCPSLFAGDTNDPLSTCAKSRANWRPG
jgi:hypothetical protein